MLTDPVTMSFLNPSATFSVTNQFMFGSSLNLDIANGARINMSNASFDNRSTVPHNQADLSKLKMTFDGGNFTTAPFEVAGLDLGKHLNGYNDNFAMDVLEIGSATGFGNVTLVNARDNSPGSGAEALYVDELIIGQGSILNLSTFNLYYRVKSIALTATITSAGGKLIQVPEPSGLSLLFVALTCGGGMCLRRSRRTRGSR
jgi:hypothetical protein